MESRLSLAFLGGFQARLGSGAPLTLANNKAQALLAYLAVSPGAPPYPRQARDAAVARHG